jgi:hypothetical protein
MNPLAAAYRAGGEISTWAKAGFPLAQAEGRLSICRECASYHSGICSECGCYMPLKARLATAQCPLGRWVDAQGE